MKSDLELAVHNTAKRPKSMPDFKSHQERDKYFRENAEYFTLIKKEGVGNYARDERKSLAEIEALAQTKITVGGGRYMVYAVIGEQSALVKTIQ